MPTGTFRRLATAPQRKCANPACGKLFSPRQEWQKFCNGYCKNQSVYLRLKSGNDALVKMLRDSPALFELAEKIIEEKRGTTNGEHTDLHPSGTGLEPGGVHPVTDGERPGPGESGA